MTLKADRKNWREELDNGLLCLLGSLLLAIGMSMFLLPNQIASGGTPGIAILICHLTGLTAGMVMLLMNIPLLIVGGYYLGQKFVWRSVLAIVMISGLVDLFYEIIRIPAGTDTPLLAAIFGGAGIGLGVGLILKGGASAGGPTIIARILATHSDLRPGYLVLFMDAAIVCSSAIVFGAIEPALHSLLSVFITGRCIDLILSNKELKGCPFPQHTAREIASTD